MIIKNKKLKKLILFYFALFHLGLIIIVVTIESIPGIQYLLTDGKDKNLTTIKSINEVKSVLKKVTGFPGIYHYSILSGTDVSYNFYAPMVARSSTLECIRYDKKRMEIDRLYFPYSLKTHEGIQRYSVSLTNFNGVIKKLDSTERNRLYRLFTKSVGLKIVQSDSSQLAKYSQLHFSSYVFPSMSDFNKGVKPTLINLVTITF
ncbi:hypothetical protein [Pedobacter gandavensis]|uniref:hypothetical protein n=1 Tax=Pedobacter gandavensis TaxID=2679963 RepID=UPI00293014F3|nr:hypothetical protein [Pedobacter gandavensis]